MKIEYQRFQHLTPKKIIKKELEIFARTKKDPQGKDRLLIQKRT